MEADSRRDEIETFFTDYRDRGGGGRESTSREREGRRGHKRLFGSSRRKAINPAMSLITPLPESLRNATNRATRPTCRGRGNVRLISMKNRDRKEMYVSWRRSLPLFRAPLLTRRKQWWRLGKIAERSELFPSAEVETPRRIIR